MIEILEDLKGISEKMRRIIFCGGFEYFVF